MTGVEDPGSGIQCCFNHWIRDKHSGSYFHVLSNNILGQKYFTYMLRILIRCLLDPGQDPGVWNEKKSDLGSGINIPDP